jgi:hypothetical protein
MIIIIHLVSLILYQIVGMGSIYKWFSYDIRRIAYILLALDLLLFISWVIIAIYPVSITCPADMLLHIILLLHFAHTFAIGAVLDDWDTEVEEKRPMKYSFYIWITSCVVALGGDIFLLVSQLIGEHIEACESTRISHIVWDSCAIAICVLSIIWFFALYYYSKRRKNKGEKKRNHVILTK